MATPGSRPSTVAPAAGRPPVRLAGSSGEAGSQEALRPRLVLFGDSITEWSFRPGGWGAALADTYSRKADVVVRGYSGYNTRWALFWMQRVFPLDGLPPVAATVFFGANDAALLGRSCEQNHVPVVEFKENLRAIVNHLKDCSKSMVILLITPPPVDEDGRERFAQLASFLH